MNTVAISQLTNTFVQFAEHELGINTSADRIETIVRDVLFTSRHLWESLNMGLVTNREVAQALAAHLHSSSCEGIINTSGDANERKWTQLIDEFEQIILQNTQEKPR